MVLLTFGGGGVRVVVGECVKRVAKGLTERSVYATFQTFGKNSVPGQSVFSRAVRG
jgi:hypothetical protein